MEAQNLTALDSSPLGVLKDLITPAVVAIAKAKLRLSDEKLALLLVKAINPAHVLRESEECILRGISDKTLRAMKQARELPRVMGGNDR